MRNAKDEATYLYTYLFANTCFNVDLADKKGQRIASREWFVVPLEVTEEAINLILNESNVNYEHGVMNKKIKQHSKSKVRRFKTPNTSYTRL